VVTASRMQVRRSVNDVSSPFTGIDSPAFNADT
jgi:hypothetical protein